MNIIKKLAVIGIALGSAGYAATGSAAEKVNFRLDWSLAGYHAPFFLAKEKGYFADEGIDVNILEGNGALPAAKLVSSNKEEFALLDFGTMVKYANQGMDLKAIYGYIQTSPMVIISSWDSNIHNPTDLKGKIIAMSPEESTAQVFPAVLQQNNIPANELNVVNPATGAKLTLLLQGKADAITGFLISQVPTLEARGYKHRYFNYADYGVNPLSLGIVSNSGYLSTKEDVAKKFLKAVSKGVADAEKNPEEAVNVALKYLPQYKDKKDILVEQLKLTIPLYHTKNTAGKPQGWQSEKDWQETVTVIEGSSRPAEKKSLDFYYTNKYID